MFLLKIPFLIAQKLLHGFFFFFNVCGTGKHRKHFGEKKKRPISKVLKQVGYFYHSTQVCIAHLLDRGGPLLDDSALCPFEI